MLCFSVSVTGLYHVYAVTAGHQHAPAEDKRLLTLVSRFFLLLRQPTPDCQSATMPRENPYIAPEVARRWEEDREWVVSLAGQGRFDDIPDYAFRL